MAVVDGVQIPRSSRTMPGFQGGLAQVSAHAALEAGQLPGATLRAPGGAAAAVGRLQPGAATPCKEWETALAQLRWLRAELDAAGRQEQTLLGLGDGSFDVAELWAALPQRTVLLARTARHHVLYERPPAAAHGNRRYGARAAP